ncbi:hypothetical protein [Flexivirga sp. B27]
MTADLQNPTDLRTMTIRELLAELTRAEDRLRGERAAGYGANPEVARLQRRIRAISAQLHERRSGPGDGTDPTIEADEVDVIEQSIPVDGDPEEEYPPQVEPSRPY